MAVIYFLFHPTTLIWPTNGEKSSFKLEALNQLNGLASGQAHDAMVDVAATVALAKKLAGQRKTWDWLIRLTQKQNDLAQIAQLPKFSVEGNHYSEGVLIDLRRGTKKRFQTPVLKLGSDNRGTEFWLDLDAPGLAKQIGNGSVSLKLTRRKPGAQQFVLPWEKNQLDADRRAQVEKNKEWIQAHPVEFHAFVNRMLQTVQPEDFHSDEFVDLDAALYTFGLPPFESDRFSAFHQADPKEKAQIVQSWPKDDFRRLALRILCRNWPETVPNIRSKFAAYIREACSGPQAMTGRHEKTKLTWQKALTEIQHLTTAGTLDDEQISILYELERRIALTMKAHQAEDDAEVL